jgi:hypothetical protein
VLCKDRRGCPINVQKDCRENSFIEKDGRSMIRNKSIDKLTVSNVCYDNLN